MIVLVEYNAVELQALFNMFPVTTLMLMRVLCND